MRAGVVGGELDERFRFCPWCGVPQRLKLVEFFQPHPLLEGDRGKALRVSRYLGDDAAPPRPLQRLERRPDPACGGGGLPRRRGGLAEPSPVPSTQA